MRLPKRGELPRCSFFFLDAIYQFSTKKSLRIQTMHRDEDAFTMERQRKEQGVKR
jgi:hypothetical protein